MISDSYLGDLRTVVASLRSQVACCIEITCLWIMGRQGVHDCRWTTVGQEESSVGSAQPIGLPGVAQRPLLSSVRGVSESEEHVIIGHQAYRSIIPGQGSCKSKELNKKPLMNPQNSQWKKNHLLIPPRDFSFFHHQVQPRDKQFSFLLTSTTVREKSRVPQVSWKEGEDRMTTNTFPTAGFQSSPGLERGDRSTSIPSLSFLLLCEAVYIKFQI